MNNKYKIPLSILGVYEILIILILSFDNLCDNIICIFEYGSCDFCDYNGLQYIILCLLIPAFFGLLWWWRSEIKQSIDKMKENKQAKKDMLYNQILEEELAQRKKTKEQKKPTFGWQQWE